MSEEKAAELAKLQTPNGCVQFSHDGVEYRPNKKGIIELPIEAVPDAVSHGFSVLDSSTSTAE